MKERYEIKVAVFLVLTRLKDNKKQILLQRRCNTGYMDDKYDMACNGHLENGETLASAVIREAKEEIDIEIKEENLELACLIHPQQEGYLNVFYSAKKYEGTPTIKEPEKCDDLQWFDVNNLPVNTIERIRNVIGCIERKITYDDGNFSNLKRTQEQER